MTAGAPSRLTPAQRAHTRRVGWLTLVYLLVSLPLAWFRATHPVAAGWSIGMAVAAAIPALGMFASWGRYLSDEHDEYHRSIALRLSAVATNITMGVAIAWGFLQAFQVMPLFAAYWFPLVWVIAQGVVTGTFYVRERGSNA